MVARMGSLQTPLPTCRTPNPSEPWRICESSCCSKLRICASALPNWAYCKQCWFKAAPPPHWCLQLFLLRHGFQALSWMEREILLKSCNVTMSAACLGCHAQNGWVCCYRWACLWHTFMVVAAARWEPCNNCLFVCLFVCLLACLLVCFFVCLFLFLFFTSKTSMFKPNITNTYSWFDAVV